jgi:hypothetical protein
MGTYQNEVDRKYISQYQKLSEEFIEKHKNKIDKEMIINYRKYCMLPSF